MHKIFGELYYLDFNHATEICKIGETTDENGQMNTLINSYKYDMIKMCIDRIIETDEEVDEENMLYGVNETTASYRLAFNSLLNSDILKIKEI